MTVLLTTYYLYSCHFCHFLPTMYLHHVPRRGQARALRLRTSQAVAGAAYICVCVGDVFIPVQAWQQASFLTCVLSPTHLLYTLRRRGLTSQQTPHGSSPARPALPVTWRQRWRARGPTARVPRSIPSGYYCGSSHRTSGPSQGWTCSGTRGRWLVPVSTSTTSTTTTNTTTTAAATTAGRWSRVGGLRPHYLPYQSPLGPASLHYSLSAATGGRGRAAACAQEGVAAAAVRPARGVLARAAGAPAGHAGGVRPFARAA